MDGQSRDTDKIGKNTKPKINKAANTENYKR